MSAPDSADPASPPPRAPAGADAAYFQPTRPELRDPVLPGFDPALSPLSPGGRRSEEGTDLLPGLLDAPTDPHPRRGLYQVRRAGWVARRKQARERFRDLHEQGRSAASRIVGKLEARGGILERARENAVRPRFNLRGKP